MGVAYVPVILSTVGNNAARPEVLQAEIDRLTRALDGVLTDPTGLTDLGRRSLFDKAFRKGVQERGNTVRAANATKGHDALDGGADNDTLAGDNAAIASPFKAGVPATQAGAKTARFDVKALIRDFGHALPNTPLTKPLVIQTTNIIPKFAQPTPTGIDTIVGGTGNDILLGTKADSLIDTSGVNYVETDGSQRNASRFKVGGDLQLAPSIRKFLASLAADPNGLTVLDGKAGTVRR
jgi:hypothetical protein